MKGSLGAWVEKDNNLHETVGAGRDKALRTNEERPLAGSSASGIIVFARLNSCGIAEEGR